MIQIGMHAGSAGGADRYFDGLCRAFDAMGVSYKGFVFEGRAEKLELPAGLQVLGQAKAPLGERLALMRACYHPHHEQLEAAVSAAVNRHGRCVVIDCHSFPSVALPYERADPEVARPDICIGTDDFHTSNALAEAFVSAFRCQGWSVSVNEPFSGAYPRPRDRRLQRKTRAAVGKPSVATGTDDVSTADDGRIVVSVAVTTAVAVCTRLAQHPEPQPLAESARRMLVTASPCPLRRALQPA